MDDALTEEDNTYYSCTKEMLLPADDEGESSNMNIFEKIFSFCFIRRRSIIEDDHGDSSASVLNISLLLQQQQQPATAPIVPVLLSLIGLTIFFGILLTIIVIPIIRPLFFSWHGYSHRFTGGLLLIWLCVGVVFTIRQQLKQIQSSQEQEGEEVAWSWFLYDTILGLLGITTTLTAANDFPHKYVQNAKGQSGSLSHKALVTQAEMIEHSFYQGLNLLQAWYLHYLSTKTTKQEDATSTTSTATPPFINFFLPLWIVTSPWLIRHKFPVHSFSHNWKITPSSQRTQQETILYQIKKLQYLFYKHVLLHGFNITMALLSLQQQQQQQSPSTDLLSTTTTTTTSSSSSSSLAFRVYWLSLNTSYVMEFFLQTLVRRRFLSIRGMFWLQQWLMLVSSIAAIWVLLLVVVVMSSSSGGGSGEGGGGGGVEQEEHQQQSSSSSSWSTIMMMPMICCTSLLLNLFHRHHDVFNVMLTGGIYYYFYCYDNSSSSF